MSLETPPDLAPKAGDQALIKIPHSEGDLTTEVWGYVLDRKSEPGEIWVVIDELVVLHRNPRYAPNSLLKVKTSQVRQLIPRDPEDPVIHLTLEDGDITEARRVDGKTSAITVRIDEGDGVAIYRIDHLGRERLDQTE